MFPRRLWAIALVSTIGFTPAVVTGQSVSLSLTYASGDQVLLGAPGPPALWPGPAPFGAPVAAGIPFTVVPGPYAGYLSLTWGSVPGAASYVLQLSTDGYFRAPYTFAVAPVSLGPAQVILIRNVPRARYYVRVHPVRSPVRWAPIVWSPVRVVDLRPGRVAIVRRDLSLRSVRQIDFVRAVHASPSGTRHAVGKGHWKHIGKPDAPGHARYPDRRGRWDDD
jgi:hypothetical protein